MAGKDLHKVFVDDEGYNSPHGHAYEHYGIDERIGAMVVVRPDQRKHFFDLFDIPENANPS